MSVRPDPTFYPPLKLAMEGPVETLAKRICLPEHSATLFM